MSKRNSQHNRRNLRASRQHPAEFFYLYEVGDEANTPGTYYTYDVRSVTMSRCTGCDCGDIMVGAITNNHRLLVLDVISKSEHEHTCPGCTADKLKGWAHLHGIPDCVIGTGDRSEPVLGHCDRDHVCEKHPATSQ